jgi:predicted secreted acid phosphatase
VTTSNKTKDKGGEPTQVPSAEDFQKYLAANPGTIIYNSELKLAYP